MDYNQIWEIIEEWEAMEFYPVQECIGWLNGDERVDIYNEYNDTDYGTSDDGMDLILEEIENYSNASVWIERVFKWIGSYEGTQLIEHIQGLYSL